MTDLDIIKQSKPSGLKLGVHVMPWHGSAGHVPFLYKLNGVYVPYDSANPDICADQCAKMLATGIDFINVDYYAKHLAATVAMFAACKAAGIGFTLCVDGGGLAVTPTSTATDQYIQTLNFLGGKFMTDAAYLKDPQGRAFVNFFNEVAGVDWNQVAASLALAMAFLFEGGAWSHLQAAGCFAWINPVTGQPQNINLDAIKAFLAGAVANPALIAWQAAYAGFDDCIAPPPWGKNRIMTRGCGRTLMQTLKALSATVSGYAMIPTWNDWEEGSAIEGGVIAAS